MPVVEMARVALIAGPQRGNTIRVIKTKQPQPVGIMQREGIAQSVRSLRCRLYPLDLKLEPIALLEVMDAPIEGHQKFEGMLVSNGSPHGYPILIGYHQSTYYATQK